MTAVECFIAELKKRKEGYWRIPALDYTSQMVKDQCLRTLDEAMSVANNLKAMERQQIEEAHSHNRCIQSQNYDCFKKAIESASDYFTQTYQQ